MQRVQETELRENTSIDPYYDAASHCAEERMLCHCHHCVLPQHKLEMCANAQCGGRPAEYRWCPLFNAAKFG